MSMGHSAVFSVVIEEEDLEKLKLEELSLFYQAVEDAGTTVEDVATVVRFEHYDIEDLLVDDPYPVADAYEKLREAFKARTGLELFLNYHNSDDDGDIYDDVSGCFWELSFSDVYMLTPEAEKLQETIPFDIQRYVVFG